MWAAPHRTAGGETSERFFRDKRAAGMGLARLILSVALQHIIDRRATDRMKMHLVGMEVSISCLRGVEG